MTKVLITGAQGVSGRNLAALLGPDQGKRVYLTDLETASGHDRFSCDLTDAAAVEGMVAEIGPDQIYHLAGDYSHDYETNYRVNVLATKYLLDACLKQALCVKVLLIGSSAEYGVVLPGENPVREDHPLSPVSTYGLSKVYQTALMKYYRNVFAMDIVMARTFNLLGDGFSRKLFVGNLLQQIVDYKNGVIDKILVGNLENRRDYLHVSEAVRCYEIIMEKGLPGEIYNVGSGQSTKVDDILAEVIAENGIDRSAIGFLENISAAKLDIRDIYADISKFSNLCQQ